MGLLRGSVGIAVSDKREENDIPLVTLEIRGIAHPQMTSGVFFHADLIDQHVIDDVSLMSAHHRHDSERQTIVSWVFATCFDLADYCLSFGQIDGIASSFFDFGF